VNQKNEKLVLMLKKVGGDINTVSLSDSNTWKHICTELEKTVRDIPEDMSGLVSLLTLCKEGIKSISEKSVPHSLSLVEAISEALTASEKYLLDNPDRELLIREAGQELAKVLGRDPGEWNCNTSAKPVYSKELTTLSLDNVAALLIQLEPNDLSGLTRLRESLSKIAADESFPESARTNIDQAAQKIDGIIEASVSDPDVVFTEIGDLIEEAMDAVEEDGAEEVDSPSTDSVPEEKTEQAAKNERADYMPEDVDPELLEEYITESNDLIVNAEEALLTLETNPGDMEAVGTVFRAFHTIKGTSAFLELTIVSEIAHHAESLLSRVRDGEIRYAGGYADLALRSIDMLKQLIESVQNALGGETLLKPEGYDDLMRLLENPEHAGISGEVDEAPGSSSRIGDILVVQGKVEREKVEEAAADQSYKPMGVKLVKSGAAKVTDVAEALRTQQRMKGAGKTVGSSVRVRTDRLDKLIDMVGEMVIAHAMVAQDNTILNGNNHELLKKIAHTSKIVRELQDLSMSMRMIPLKSTFQKMTRLVRDLANKTGKTVNFVTEGEDTEIDRNMVDVINDPLMHMVRNAVDHGIELPEAREKIGKPKYGTVQLSAYHSAGSVVVEIKDDGKGLDREAILARARERGLVSEGSLLSDREVFSLIFEPGFSTAKRVTDVSGRGVGMDVVKKNIEALRGHVEIQSELGKGSVFQIRLPLTLAIIDGMVARVGCETYIIPTLSITTSIKPDPRDLSTVLNKGEMLSFQGKLIPLFRLASLFHIEGAEQVSNQALVVVVEDNGSQAGLIIDELIGRQQVVIKTLGETMRDLPGISGGAIMPNGRVGLILDIGGLVVLANEGNGKGVEVKL